MQNRIHTKDRETAVEMYGGPDRDSLREDEEFDGRSLLSSIRNETHASSGNEKSNALSNSKSGSNNSSSSCSSTYTTVNFRKIIPILSPQSPESMKNAFDHDNGNATADGNVSGGQSASTYVNSSGMGCNAILNTNTGVDGGNNNNRGGGLFSFFKSIFDRSDTTAKYYNDAMYGNIHSQAVNASLRSSAKGEYMRKENLRVKERQIMEDRSSAKGMD